MEELKPIHDGRKSFWKRAYIKRLQTLGVTYLVSYSTYVCFYDAKGRFHRAWRGWSRTTMRHIVEFVKQFGNGVGPLTKKEWEALPVEDDARKVSLEARAELLSMEAK